MFTLAKSCNKKVNNLRDWSTDTQCTQARRKCANTSLSVESGDNEHRFFLFLSSHSCFWGQELFSNISMYVNISSCHHHLLATMHQARRTVTAQWAFALCQINICPQCKTVFHVGIGFLASGKMFLWNTHFFLFSHFHMTKVNKCHLSLKKEKKASGPILASSPWQTNRF